MNAQVEKDRVEEITGPATVRIPVMVAADGSWVAEGSSIDGEQDMIANLGERMDGEGVTRIRRVVWVEVDIDLPTVPVVVAGRVKEV